jgi:DNA helicase II / ATP-dependent DNA helicase PcrA
LNSDEWLSRLNPAQLEAVKYQGGPLVVFAGAGSGKTRIITSRIAYLIQQGVPPREILAVTFTNKAAGEMRERVEALIPDGKRCLIATFHSACTRFLREFAEELGFEPDFTIYDQQDSQGALKTVIAEAKLELGDNSLDDYQNAISRAKTKGIHSSDALQLAGMDARMFPPWGAEIYDRYQAYLAKCNAMDFGDLILNLLLLLRNNSKVRGILQNRFSHVLVDEYQDTNPTQFELISYLVEKTKNLFVVGDDDQSIYSWRGATPANIIEFRRLFPGSHHITLSQNYRCTKNIVGAASALIRHNVTRVEKELWTDNEAGDFIQFSQEPDGSIEAMAVVDSIVREARQFANSQIAVFYRTNSQSRQLEEAFIRANVPYRVFGSLKFYERMEVKDILAYLRFLANSRDDVSFRRIINTPPRGLGDAAVAQIASEAISKNISMFEAAKLLAEAKLPRISAKLGAFVGMISGLQRVIPTVSLSDLLAELLDQTDYRNYLRKRFVDQYPDKIENIHELGTSIAEFVHKRPADSLVDWLQSIALVSAEEEAVDGVNLMTLHMAKGLEFKRVYIVGVEDGLIPHRSSMESAAELEEERRLLYVGMTRARERLSLFCAAQRRNFDQYVANRPSRFLREIPTQFFEPVPVPAAVDSYRRSDGRPSHTASDSDSDGYHYDYDELSDDRSVIPGSSVVHLTYGNGVVRELVAEFGKEKVIVDFSHFGAKKVLKHHLRPR